MKKDQVNDLLRVEFDGKKGRVIFHGDCHEMRAVCQAMCCRHEWRVGISVEEYSSGEYDAAVICALTGKVCRDASFPCINRRYQLSKRPDKSCVYLKNNRCRIYTKRPRVCREFQCQGGWQLAAVLPANRTQSGQESHVLSQENSVKRLAKNMIFIPHPLLKVHTVFYLKPKREIIFVKEMVGSCGKFSTRGDFDYPLLDDDRILALIDMFSRKETIDNVYQRFCGQYVSILTLQELYEIVWILNKHNILLDSRNFSGFLGGIGAVG